MRRTEFSFANGRGQQLHGVEFLPDGKPWANLIWHHGVCEHSGRYTPVFQHMAERGVAVYSFDVHGHGRSEPSESSERCLIHSYSHLIPTMDARFALALALACSIALGALGQEEAKAPAGSRHFFHPKPPTPPPGSFSRYDPSTKRYLPVTSDVHYDYYRIKVSYSVKFSDTKRFQDDPVGSPEDPKKELVLSISAGDLTDIPTGQVVGGFESSQMIGFPQDEPGGLVAASSQITAELGPERNDSITIAGSLAFRSGTNPILDSDMAVTGGTGVFLGAGGSSLSVDASTVITTIIVPRFKTGW